ncbi:hypothetical protein MASR1M31_12190 [Porphyromonadaceae bacterium]
MLGTLDKKALRRILTEPKNSIIKQYEKLFSMDHIDLVFERRFLTLLSCSAIEFKLGARGLRSITETIMMDLMYDSPSTKPKKVTVTPDASLRKRNLIEKIARDCKQCKNSNKIRVIITI